MSVIEKLKAESIALRKTRNPVAASITFALSEIEKIGKNNGNRPTTEDEAIKVVQKLVATLKENLKLDMDKERYDALVLELSILSSVLPQMVSDHQIEVIVTGGLALGKNKGEIMKAIRAEFGALVDMKRAGEILDLEMNKEVSK